MATAIIAVVGLGVDVVGWYRTDRAIQNAADSAAIAAAANWGHVSRRGVYADGSNGVTVSALNN